jgi:hypothetical protein
VLGPSRKDGGLMTAARALHLLFGQLRPCSHL